MSTQGPTLSELDRKVRSRLPSEDVAYVSSQNVLDWLNEGQDVICADAPWTVVSGWAIADTAKNADSYLMPSACIRATAVEVHLASGEPHRLEYMEPDWFDGRKSYASRQTGVPRFVTYRQHFEGVAFEMYPAPSAKLPIYVSGYMRPTPLSLSTDRTDVPFHVAPTLIAYAITQATFKDEENQEFLNARKMFDLGMSTLRSVRLRSQADQANVRRARRSLFGVRPWVG